VVLAVTSDTLGQGRLFDAASISCSEAEPGERRRQVVLGGSSLPGVRVEINPTALTSTRSAWKACGRRCRGQRQLAQGALDIGERRYQIYSNDQASTAANTGR